MQMLSAIYALRGESRDLLRGTAVRGHVSPEKMENKAIFLSKCLGKNSLKISIFITTTILHITLILSTSKLK